MSASCKAAQNTLGAGGAWYAGHDVLAHFVLSFFSFLVICGRENMNFVPLEPLNRRFQLYHFTWHVPRTEPKR